VIDRGGWEVISENEDGEEIIRDVETTSSDGDDLLNHMKNFVECIRNRERPTADIEITANTAIVASLGNIAYRTGERIEWDHAARRITNVERANELLKTEYRDPYNFPGNLNFSG
jgi:hypothetical protein